jgi:hypothetical protein
MMGTNDTNDTAQRHVAIRLFEAGFAIGLLGGFAAALLEPRRSAERKPATAARMRPPVEAVDGDGGDGGGDRTERRWASLSGSVGR